MKQSATSSAFVKSPFLYSFVVCCFLLPKQSPTGFSSPFLPDKGNKIYLGDIGRWWA